MIDRSAATEVVGAPLQTHAGDRFDLGEHQMVVAETEWKLGFGRYVTAWLVPPLLAARERLRFLARAEGRSRPLTAEPLPCHDPPVAWHVDTAWGRSLDLPCIACPALLLGGIVPMPNLPDEVPVLDGEPGQRS